jgi:glutathione S-transferase
MNFFFDRWESRAILRYLASKYGLEAWYPADLKLRANCEEALEFHAKSFVPTVGKYLLYPAKFAGSVPTKEQLDTVVKNFQPVWQELWPTLKALLDKRTGPFLGGENPNIADLAFFGYLIPLFGLFPDIKAATDLKGYYTKLTERFPKDKKYLAEALAFWVLK